MIRENTVYQTSMKTIQPTLRHPSKGYKWEAYGVKISILIEPFHSTVFFFLICLFSSSWVRAIAQHVCTKSSYFWEITTSLTPQRLSCQATLSSSQGTIAPSLHKLAPGMVVFQILFRDGCFTRSGSPLYCHIHLSSPQLSAQVTKMTLRIDWWEDKNNICL